MEKTCFFLGLRGEDNAGLHVGLPVSGGSKEVSFMPTFACLFGRVLGWFKRGVVVVASGVARTTVLGEAVKVLLSKAPKVVSASVVVETTSKMCALKGSC